MTDHKEILNAFIDLGAFFRAHREITETDPTEISKNEWHNKFNETILLAGHKNGWFTRENIMYAVTNWGALLTKENLENWLATYDIGKNRHKTVAIIMAGNIPLVGFHDFLAVILTGNKAVIKLSSNDKVLLPFIASFLISKCASLKEEIEFTENKLEGFDAVIATGSDNTSRYFEHYFGNKPHVIRKNRNAVAILDGQESSEQLQALGEDIFRYYGLGCRSVSKVFVPKGYNFDDFFKALYDFHPIIEQTKYANNYDYNKAVYLMSGFKILENGFLMIKEDDSYSSPIATLFYEQYDSLADLKSRLAHDREKIQCVVANDVLEDEVKFGLTQKPGLGDYADDVDTVEFLLKT
ncbi:MAG: acyl-CoA reductase [Maribacter sp.]|nr:acyl-CoA reductase [Maribacter sp.]MBT8313578.1 acyl-CoA reductase [Maribacter sp.]